MTEHRLDDLIREINPDSFSPAAHGEGHRIVHSPRETRVYKKTLLGRFLGGRDERHYFVKHFRVPKEVKDWTFHWSEGTSALSLDFDSSFVIQANREEQAMKLVQVLAGPEKPGEALFGLVSECLHAELVRLLQECNARNRSLLDCFRRSSIGIGESQQLNERVSERVAGALGGASFRIGFQLRNAPPLQIEIDHPEAFTLADSERPRTAKTTALLQLVNYQAYKKSRLETADAIREAICGAISKSVKQLLFGRRYYEVVQSFRSGEGSVEKIMRRRIEEEALTIGYSVDMFQTFPDIAALDLLEWKRIDMAASEQGYSLRNSTSDVRIAISLSVRVTEGGFGNLHLLVDPDDDDVESPIKERVAQVCRDALQPFSWQQFNLEFDPVIAPALRTVIVKELRGCGLETQVIRIAQEPTDDVTRYRSLLGRTIGFSVVITPQGNVGRGDAVTVVGKVEVTPMRESGAGWSAFESKDLGFRADSRITETRLRQLAAERDISVPEAAPLPVEERHAIAIEIELCEIRDRVVATLREAMSKVRDLAGSWRTLEGSEQIIAWAQKIACEAVEKEFGVTIALRSVYRTDTGTEAVAQLEQRKAVELAEALLTQDVLRETEQRKVADAHQINVLTQAGSKELLALDDEGHARHTQLLDAASASLNASAASPRLTASAVRDLLKQPEPQEQEQLPWLSGEAGESDEREPRRDNDCR